MTVSRKKRLIAAIALAGAMLGGASISPANADCASTSVYTRKPGGQNSYIVGPKACLTPNTPYQERYGGPTEVATGQPAVGTVGVGVWIPAPPVLAE